MSPGARETTSDDPGSDDDPTRGREPFPVVGLVAGCAVGLVVVIGVLMAVALRGGATRGDADGLATDVSVFTTVVLSSRPPERAYDHLSAECREQIDYPRFERAVTDARADIEEEFGIDLGLLAVAEVATRSVDDGRGEASVSFEEIGFDEIPVGEVFEATGWSTWAYESGLWRATDCTDPGDLVRLEP
jgi:hypothetical protein